MHVDGEDTRFATISGLLANNPLENGLEGPEEEHTSDGPAAYLVEATSVRC